QQKEQLQLELQRIEDELQMQQSTVSIRGTSEVGNAQSVSGTEINMTDGISVPAKRARLTSPANDRGFFQIFVRIWIFFQNKTVAYQCEDHGDTSVA
ncbi:hypothetical protein PENTCL1PPCAC_7347, partial [Pristionchus entomophagus]